MPVVEAQALIRSALRLATVKASGEKPEDYEEADALITLNDLLSLWSLDPLLNFESVHFTVEVTSTATPILMQASTVVDPALRVTTAQFRESGQDTPLTLISEQEYQDIGDKALSGTPCSLYIDRRVGPLQLYLYPVPAVGTQIILTGQQPFTSFASLTTKVTLQTGYEGGLRYNLALLLAGEYGRTPADTTLFMATEFNEKLKSLTNSTRVPRTQRSNIPAGDVAGYDSNWTKTGGFG